MDAQYVVLGTVLLLFAAIVGTLFVIYARNEPTPHQRQHHHHMLIRQALMLRE
jgi:hypothetical protein